MCLVSKPDTDFNKNRSRKDGLQTRCRECDGKLAKANYHKKYRKQTIKRAKARKQELRQWIISKKQTMHCEKCGESRWYVLDFHHKQEKDDSIAQLVARGCCKKRIEAEIAKCQVLCSNCHREVHYLNGTKLIW